MSQLSDYALDRLRSILPLAHRQAALSLELRTLHRAFLHTLVEQGRAMSSDEIADFAPGRDTALAIWILAAADLIVLGRDGHPVGAYPITVEPTPFELTIDGASLYAMCAFDAVSVAPMFDAAVAIRSRCPITGVELRLEQRGGELVQAAPSSDVQVGIWWRNPGSVAARNLCPGIVFLRDRAAALAWQAGDTDDHDIANLYDAIDAGARFFRPLVAEERPRAGRPTAPPAHGELQR